MEFGDKVFVVTSDKVIRGIIHHHISHRGVVTGYSVRSEELQSSPATTNFARSSIFVDEEDAAKALFKRKLKADETVVIPAADKVGDRHWIAGHRRNGYGR
jgi:hypothetical protein